jgi:hypothetical protein
MNLLRVLYFLNEEDDVLGVELLLDEDDVVLVLDRAREDDMVLVLERAREDDTSDILLIASKNLLPDFASNP